MQKNAGNFLHGGATATLVDLVGSAVIYTYGVSSSGVSVEINVSYLDAAYVDVSDFLLLLSFIQFLPKFAYVTCLLDLYLRSKMINEFSFSFNFFFNLKKKKRKLIHHHLLGPFLPLSEFSSVS